MSLTIFQAVLSTLACSAQNLAAGASNSSSAPNSLEQHFEAARTFQTADDDQHAAIEYKAFLAEALRRIGNARANTGARSAAVQAFEQALALDPDNPDLLLEYATLRLQERKLPEARSLVEGVLKLAPQSARAHYLLGQVFFAQENYKQANHELEKAMAMAPNFEIAYLFAATYLKLNDLEPAQHVFDEMVRVLGESAPLHIHIGLAYRMGGFDGPMVDEFKKAIALDRNTPRAHYFLGMAYLKRDSELLGFAEAAPEFRAEIANFPNDFGSHYMLGYIALAQQNWKEAESELLRATELDPSNPEPFAYLGRLYAENARLAEAESALRRSIALTTDVSRNEFQVARSHYLLGHVLLKTGRHEESEKEFQASKETRLLAHGGQVEEQDQHSTQAPSMMHAQDSVAGSSDRATASPEESRQAQAYEKGLASTLAGAYNNLGVGALNQKNFAVALSYFQAAAIWAPALPVLDRNLGMAAFQADQYGAAIEPLQHHLQAHPEDAGAKAALALSFFGLKNYAQARAILDSMEDKIDADHRLAYAYAVCLMHTGDYARGAERLRAMETATPASPR